MLLLCKEVPEAPQLPQETDVLTEEQKKQLGELQFFRNKEGSVSIEVSLHFLDPFVTSHKTLIHQVNAPLVICR